MKNKNSKEFFLSFHKAIAVSLAISLLFSNSIGYAMHPTTITSEVAKSSEVISLPAELGKIEESFQGSSGKTIIYVQDAHDSLEAQENIAKTISYLVEQRGIKTVYEEGYEGPVPTDEYFGFIKDPIVKEKVSYFLMDKLRIGGAEYAHINRKNDFKLIGADNIKLHLENIKQYRETAELSQDTKQDLQAAQSEISRLANQRFSKELKEWIKLKERLTANQLDLLSYLKRIKDLFMQHTSKQEFQTRYSNIDLILSVETANKKEIAEKAKAIDSKILFQEIEQLENDYANTQLKNEQDKKTFQYYKGLQLLSRLDEIKLTSTEFDAVKESFQKLKTDDLAKFVAKSTNKPVVLFKRWEQNIQNAIRFYELAGARDQSLGKNFDEFLKNKNEKVALLVFGGFHKDEIKQILRAKNLSYSILMPAITSVDQRHQDYYKQLMSMGSYSFEVPMNLAKAARAITTFLRARIIGPQPVRAELRALSSIVASNKNLEWPLLNRNIEAQLKRSEVRQAERTFNYPAGKFNVTVTNPNLNQIATSEGVVSVGMTMVNRNLANNDADKFPRIFLTPADQQWIGEDGSNLIQFYFAVAANWHFHKRKTTIVVKDQSERDRIYRYLQLGNPYELPKVAGSEYDDALYQRFRREAIALADRGAIDGKLQIITPEDQMVDFVIMANNTANVGNVAITFDSAKKAYAINDRGAVTELAATNLRAFDVTVDQVQPLSEKPEFGLTFLGTSGGMDINGLTSNAIVWAGKKGILQDAGAPTVALLTGLGITPGDIDYLIITHMHEDHVAGALQFFQWMKAANKELTLVVEPGIFQFFKEQMELVLNDKLENVFPNVHFVASKFYEEIVFGEGENQIRLKAIPAFHGTPTASYRIDYAGKTVSLSSDTTIAPLRLTAYLTPGLPGIPDEVKADLKALTNWKEDGAVFDTARANEIQNALLDSNASGIKPAYVVMEIGYGKATTITDLTNHTYANDLKIYSEEDQKLLITNHAAGLPAGETFSFQHAVPLQTYWVIPNRSEVRSEQEKFIATRIYPETFFDHYTNDDIPTGRLLAEGYEESIDDYTGGTMRIPKIKLVVDEPVTDDYGDLIRTDRKYIDVPQEQPKQEPVKDKPVFVPTNYGWETVYEDDGEGGQTPVRFEVAYGYQEEPDYDHGGTMQVRVTKRIIRSTEDDGEGGTTEVIRYEDFGSRSEMRTDFGNVENQRAGVTFFKNNVTFQGSKGESPVGTMVADPDAIRIDVRHLQNAQGNLTITDRATNRRTYAPNKDVPPTSDTKVIREKYLPFGVAMNETLQSKAGSEPLTWLDFSNNFGNPNHVSYARGQVFYPTGFTSGKKFEQNLAKPLFSLIQYSDGKIEFGFVHYEVTKSEKVEGYYDEVQANAFLGEELLPQDTAIFSAIPLIVNGQPADLPSAIRDGMFQDLRHLFSCS